MEFDFVLLGAEKQSASSFALAYPDKTFLFVTDQAIVDGWDIPNVRIAFSKINDIEKLPGRYRGKYVSLSSRWTALSVDSKPAAVRCSLFDNLEKIYKHMPELALRIGRDLATYRSSPVILKGDLWHKPDAPEIISEEYSPDMKDEYGCGFFYQEFVPGPDNFVSVGYVEKERVRFGIVQVHRESIAREDHIVAAETVNDERLSDLTLRAIAHLGYQGFFTLNWVKVPGRVALTSFRPEPKALFGLLKKAGCDLLGDAGAMAVKPGVKMIGNIHYSSYHELAS
ncbi:MAG: hypothetical protein AB1458_13900 [Bacteroidota bacterium]